ncbi:MAG: helix-turn-helix transcriptional regulator [Deltaproteobacteria bacterium]|nr:helix-turn-helix transcriptional regulator [Deltaproteobacteria bacterium]
MARAHTDGRYRLLSLVQGTTRQSVATQIGVTPATVSRWVSGHLRPAADARRLLEQLFSIPASAWGAPTLRWRRRSTYRVAR